MSNCQPLGDTFVRSLQLIQSIRSHVGHLANAPPELWRYPMLRDSYSRMAEQELRENKPIKDTKQEPFFYNNFT